MTCTICSAMLKLVCCGIACCYLCMSDYSVLNYKRSCDLKLNCARHDAAQQVIA